MDSTGGHTRVTTGRYRAAMSLTDRTAPRPAAYVAPDPDRVGRVADALLDAALEPIVDMVVTADGDAYEARTVDGRVRFRREVAPADADGEGDGERWRFVDVEVDGRNPLGDTATDRFPPLADELANRWPDRTQQAYPHAYEQIAQLFDHPAAPDLVCLHTPAHNWEDQGGERGEHGSLGVVQARAPFVLAGAGVRHDGLVPRSCRLVDVAPTVLALLGAEPRAGGGLGPTGAPRSDALLARQDGRVLTELLDPADRPDHVVGFLFDGTNANVLYDMAAAGEAPNVARLLAMGTGWPTARWRRCRRSPSPTTRRSSPARTPATTASSTTPGTTGTGRAGHHQLAAHLAVGDADACPPRSRRSTRRCTAPSPAPSRCRSTSRATPAPTTRPSTSSARAATWCGRPRPRTCRSPPSGSCGRRSRTRCPRASTTRAWTRRSTSGTAPATAARPTGAPLPRFTWVNFTLTDAAFHEGGPYSDIARASVHDTDARLGEILDAVERAGVFDRTAFFLVADHGMEETNPEVTGDWAPALADTGIPYRDEAYGFVYVDV